MKHLFRPKAVCFAVIVALLLAAAFKLGLGTYCAAGLETIASLCPLGTLENYAASGSVTARSLIFLALLVASVLLFGRYFCGWFCPSLLVKSDPAAQKKKCIPIHPEKPAKAQRSTSSALPLGILAGSLLSSAVFGLPVFCLICPIGLFFAFILGAWHLVAGTDVQWLTLAAPLVLVFEWIVLRRWCHSFCPIGALLTLLSRFNKTFRPAVNKAKCLAHQGEPCQVCRTVCPEGIDLTAENPDLSRCTKCRRCAELCPQQAISFPFFAKPAEKPADKTPPRIPLTPAASVRRDTVQAEAGRCLLCGRCEAACPQAKPIADVMRLVKLGKTRAASDLLAAPGMLSDICGAVCPSDALCEKACPLAKTGEAIAIRRIERELAHERLPRGLLPAKPAVHGKKAAVVGSGPAGLACAEVLQAAGVAVTIFEAEPRAGGWLAYAIPAAKLPKSAVAAVAERLQNAGVTIRTGCRVGRDIEWSKIVADFDAVFCATGVPTPVASPLASSDKTQVAEAIDFLHAEAQSQLETSRCGTAARGKHVVCAGGATAFDAAAVALAQGALSVTVLMRRAEAAVRVSPADIGALKKRGVRFLFETTMEATDAGEALLHIRTKGEPATIESDLVLRAFGFRGFPDEALNALGVAYDDAGRLVTDENHRTGCAKVFAGGDAVTGATLVTKAAESGRLAAQSILASFE